METGNHHTIDVTGLPSEAVGVVESLVSILRRNLSSRLGAPTSIFTLFGKTKSPRTAEDISQQLRQERTSWDDV